MEKVEIENVIISKIDLLSEEEKRIANKLIKEYYQKIKRAAKGDFSLKITIKEYSKGGKTKKYDLAAEMVCAETIFRAKAFDWDFARTLHKLLIKILNEMEHKLHHSEQW